MADSWIRGNFYWKRNEKMKDSFENLYEVLQLSPRADQLIINKAYRLLAALYHPDHKQTGDEEKFKKVLKAYSVLSDPAQRMQYDNEYSRHMAKAPGPLPVVGQNGPGPFATRFQQLTHKEEPEEDSSPRISERELRRLLLLALYDVRRNHPQEPEVNLIVLAELVGSPISHLEFSLWYLKEKGFIKMDESANLMVTVIGVDYVENELISGTEEKDQLYLPEARVIRHHGPSSSMLRK
jgi:curved DNA-binding protein